MRISPIKTAADYEAALRRIDRLMDARRNTRRGDELDVLVTLVEAYESKMMRRLHERLDIPSESFLRPVRRARGKRAA